MTAASYFIAALISLGVTLTVLFLRQLVIGGVEAYFKGIEQRIKSQNSRDLEVLKNDLRAQADADLEKERAGLRVVTESYLSRVSHLVERRLEVLVSLYSLIVTVQSTLERYVNPAQVFFGIHSEEDMKNAKKQLQDAAIGAYREFYDFVPPNRVFLDDETCKQVDAFWDAVSEIIKDYNRASMEGYIKPDLWEDAHNRAKDLLPTLIENLRRQIGSLIGVEHGAPKL